MTSNTNRLRTTKSSNEQSNITPVHDSLILPISPIRPIMIDVAINELEAPPTPEGAGEPTYSILQKESGDGELLEVAMGPQHPSTHGVFRMDVVLDGETVVKLKPVFGYLHRNHEQIAERTSYLASMP